MAAASARTAGWASTLGMSAGGVGDTDGSCSERAGFEREGGAGGADRLGEPGPGERRCLDGLAHLVLGDGELGICARFVRSWAQLVAHQCPNGLGERLQPIDVGTRGPYRFVRRKDAEERVGGGGSRIELRQRGLRAGEGGLSPSSLDVGLAHAEVDSLP